MHNPPLRQWQEEFVSSYVAAPSTRTLLVAPVGTGKSATAIATARRLIDDGQSDAALVLADNKAIQTQWRHIGQTFGLALGDSLLRAGSSGAASTVQSLRIEEGAPSFAELASARRWFIVADEMHRNTASVNGIVDRFLRFNRASRALFISSSIAPSERAFDEEFRFNSELVFGRTLLKSHATEVNVRRYAPSFSLLRELQKGPTAIDGLSWRAFEKLIATLLERDGYEVELMKGSKDNGVDVIASKDLGPHGLFRAVWQAKQQGVRSKVGISVVRELADTRDEFGASKGIIVTSSYLTKGALDRITRDKYILGKVDRDDLDAWIWRTLYGREG